MWLRESSGCSGGVITEGCLGWDMASLRQELRAEWGVVRQIWGKGITGRCWGACVKTLMWEGISVCCRHSTKERILAQNVETGAVSHLQRWPPWRVVYKYVLLMSLGCGCLTRNTVRPLPPPPTSSPPTSFFAHYAQATMAFLLFL